MGLALQIEKDGDVHVLQSGNFDKMLQDNQVVLVKFYSPDCEHCRDMAEDFKRAAATLRNSGSPAKLAEVNCAAEGTVLRTIECVFAVALTSACALMSAHFTAC
jgi:thiol-disulfide isomerase/thioredoxin